MLIKKNANWIWTSKPQAAFEHLKSLLTSAQTLAHFNPLAETCVVTDASPYGLGAVIVQKQDCGNFRPVSYASRTLTEVERRYSQVERESLAIYFGIQRFKLYLYGLSFEVITDHKPLVSLFSPNAKPPPRIERWIMRLAPFTFHVTYQAGSKNSADYLSRSNPLPHSKSDDRLAEQYIYTMLRQSTPIAVSLKHIQDATNSDKIYLC